jgi:hypothetical protein
MSLLYGALNINDAERVFLGTLGQQVVYDAVTEYFNRHNEDLQRSMAVFVDRQTTDHKLRYVLPGGGKMQKIGTKAAPGAVKRNGSWDVAFPLTGYGDSFAGDRVSMGYMTVQDLDAHLQTIAIRNVNSVRWEILHRILDNAQETFDDPLYGNLSIEPLANGDTVVYPPVIGSETEATEDHYLVSGYTAANISDTNNPYYTMQNDLVQHFGETQGNDNVVVMINPAQTAKTEDLTGFVALTDRFVQAGNDTATLFNLPAGVPGRIIGRVSGCWVAEWRWMPENYMVGVHLDAPKPLYERVDPAYTGLGTGLQLVNQSVDHPFEQWVYEHRFGFGAANRLNGVVMYLDSGESYTIPTSYD